MAAHVGHDQGRQPSDGGRHPQGPPRSSPRKSARSPIDDTEGDGVEQIMELTGGKGADRGCECVGYQCCNMHREEVPNLTMNNLVQTVKATGRIGVVGVFVPEDPSARTSSRSAAAWRSTSARSGSRARAWAPAKPTSKPTTASSADLIEKDKVEAVVDRLARAAAGAGAGGLRELRPEEERLDQGRAEARELMRHRCRTRKHWMETWRGGG